MRIVELKVEPVEFRIQKPIRKYSQQELVAPFIPTRRQVLIGAAGTSALLLVSPGCGTSDSQGVALIALALAKEIISIAATVAGEALVANRSGRAINLEVIFELFVKEASKPENIGKLVSAAKGIATIPGGGQTQKVSMPDGESALKPQEEGDHNVAATSANQQKVVQLKVTPA